MGPKRIGSGPLVKSGKVRRALNAERTAAAAGTFHVRIIKLKAGALERLDIINRNPVQIHFAHLVHQDLKAVKLVDVVSRVFLVLECHVIAES